MIVYIAIAVIAFLALRFVLRFALPTLGILVLLGLILGGCAKPSPAIEVAGPTVPDQLLTCRDEPTPPATGTQRAVALYVIDLAEAGDDCRAKLGAVRSIVRPPEK